MTTRRYSVVSRRFGIMTVVASGRTRLEADELAGRLERAPGATIEIYDGNRFELVAAPASGCCSACWPASCSCYDEAGLRRVGL